MRALFRLVVLAVLVIPIVAHGQQPCQPLTNCRANGHHATKDSFYPFSEDIAFQQSQPISQVTVTGPSSSWTIVATGCADVARNNLFAGAPFHTRLLAWLQIGATTVAPGGHYEVQFLVDGVPGGWFVRSYRGMLPQGDHFGAIRKDLTAGTHRFEVQVRLLAPGSMTFTQQYTTSMGTPTSFPFGGSTAAPAFTIDGQWRQVTNEVTFSNSVPIDLYPMAYLQWNSGTPNDSVRVKFMLDGVQPPRTSDIAVPPYFRDGINIFDHFKNVPPGTHRISLWARNLNNRPASVSFRTVEIASYPAASAHASNPILTEAAATDTRTIDPTIVSAEQPPFDSGGVCGYWTKILEFDIPPHLRRQQLDRRGIRPSSRQPDRQLVDHLGADGHRGHHRHGRVQRHALGLVLAAEFARPDLLLRGLDALGKRARSEDQTLDAQSVGLPAPPAHSASGHATSRSSSSPQTT